MALPRTMRLARMIALASELSRRAAEKAISSGQVMVNGKVISALGTKVDPVADRVCLRGRPLRIKAEQHYLAFYKPRNILVTKRDPKGRHTIWDHLKEWKASLNSVGRLDFDSEGLLLLTDDGDFLNALTHPRHGVWKVYHVRVKGVPCAAGLGCLRDGVALEDGRTLPARVKRIDRGDPNALIEIGIREGRNRQVRRMFARIGCPVTRLKRVAIGSIKLGRLRPGRWRHLRQDEVSELLKQAKSVR